MTSYRITKFDPAKRNELGAYLDQAEWTAISDIGKSGGASALTYEEYEKTETAYVNAVQAILAEQGVDWLTVKSLELYATKPDFDEYRTSGRLRNLDVCFDQDVKSLQNGLVLHKAQLSKVVRLVLRETVWMLLVSEGIEVKFGYDYYMYVICTPLKDATIAQIEASGLFVEQGVSQLEFEIIDNDGDMSS